MEAIKVKPKPKRVVFGICDYCGCDLVTYGEQLRCVGCGSIEDHGGRIITLEKEEYSI